MHEKRLHTNSAFLTLTYSDANLPPGGTLVPEHLTNFLKRLRHEYPGEKVRYFACGEYGTNTARPHYHVLLLNQNFADQQLVKSGSKYNLYNSKRLSRLWPFGQHAIGDVTFESAAYTARYCMKKNQNGKTVKDGRKPEYIVMSRNPGLGKGYFDKYKDEILSHDSIIVNGHPNALPRFYNNELAGLTELSETSAISLYTKLELIKIKRRRKLTYAQRSDNSQRRLRIQELVMLAKLKIKGTTL